LEGLRQSVADTGLDPAYISAWQEVGYLVTDVNRHLFSAEEVQAYLDAVERHQLPPLPDRPLPADLFAVDLTVRHRRAWSAEPSEEPERWEVSADAYDSEGGRVVSHVGDFRFIVLDLYETEDAYRLLSDEGGRASKIAKVIFDCGSGQLIDDLEESIEPMGDRLLIVDEVRLEPEWRGFGIGALLVASAINTLSGGVRAVACYPEPADFPGSGAGDGGRSARSKQAVPALDKVCERIGFEHFRDGVWMLDLNLVTFEEAFARLRTEAQRYGRS
jgi:GNAT superfamily N-acetyltransferase